MKNMIIILLALIINLHAVVKVDPCFTDVYFGNGVWNDIYQARDSKDELRRFLQESNQDFFSIENENITYEIKYMHNETYETIDDLIETYWQLYSDNQISEGYFTFVSKVLNTASFNFDF